MADNVVRTISFRGTSEGLDELTTKLRLVASEEKNIALVSDDLSKRTISLAAAWKATGLRLDETARATDNYNRLAKQSKQLLDQHGISAEQHAERLKQLGERYGQASAGAAKLTAGMSAAGDVGAVASQRMIAGLSDVGKAADRAAQAMAKMAASAKPTADQMASSRLTTGMTAAGDVGGVASQRMVAGMTAASKAAAEASTSVTKSYSQMITGMSAAGDASAVASQKMIAGMSAMGTATEHTANFTKQSSRAGAEMLNLSRQFADVGVSLQAGQSPFTVLVQQGAQIVDVFASSNRSVGSFFSQAIGWAGRFFASTAGIVTGILAIGGAAVYAASQFVRAQTTIAEALEEQNRLLKEGKALIDERTSAEARAQLQSKEQTQFETLRNQLDLQIKLNKAMEDMAKIAERRATTPTGGGMPEMGIAPSGVAPLRDPGYDQIAAAIQRLQAAQAAGMPGLKEFNSELGKIGLAHPELALIVQDMIKAGEAGMQLEFAALRAKAMSDALAGIAKDAQLAAVGLGSIAQFKLNNRMAEEARDATERQAKAVLQMAEAYPGMSIEVAKQLNALEGQLLVAQEITGKQQIEAQFLVNINSLLLQGKTLTEATAVAEAQRAISLAQVNTAAQQTLISAQREYKVLIQTDEETKNYVRSLNRETELLESGVDAQRAKAVAAQEYMNAEEQRSQAAQQASEREEEASAAATAAADERARAYRRAADAADQEAIAMQNAASAAIDAVYQVQKFIPHLAAALGGTQSLYQSKQGGYSQFNPAGYTSTYDPGNATFSLTQTYGAGGFDPATGQPNAQGQAYAFNKLMAGGGTSGAISSFISSGLTSGANPLLTSQLGRQPTLDTSKVGLLTSAIDTLPKEQQAGPLQQLLSAARALPASLESAQLIQQLNDKLTSLTTATEANTSATQTMTDVLSPFYSSDPRQTHLGFRAFAGGGIMTQDGMLPLRQYQGGGMATSPQVAVFGEGSTPEAYVPVPSGRIPVEIKQPANSNRRPVHVTINVMGNADSGTVAALKSTAFQQAQAMRRMIG